MAQIVETLRLQHEHPEREQYAWDSLQEDGYNCSRLWLIKEYDSAFLFGMELMPDEDNED